MKSEIWGSDGHQAIIAELHKKTKLKDELNSYKTFNVKIWSNARYSGSSPQRSALFYTSMEYYLNIR